MRFTPPARGVTFDFGQTLADLDTDLLARRLGERGLEVDPAAIEARSAAAWAAYGAAIRAGVGGHPWKLLMHELLVAAVPDARAREAAVDWLWTEQPKTNLWRRPVPGMIELVRELCGAGVPVGIVSNSEGRLEELAIELGIRGLFGPVADSGKLGLEKPGAEIFAWAAERLGVPLDRLVHVGDALAADVEGALGAGMAAIWFRGDRAREPSVPEDALVARDAAETRACLARLGLPLA